MGKVIKDIIGDHLEHIAFLAEDIGGLVSVRESFHGNESIRQMAEYLIRVRQVEIDTTEAAIHECRTSGAA